LDIVHEEEHKSRILIVDDEPFNIDSLEVIIQFSLPKVTDLHSRIDRAFNGQQAVDQFKKAIDAGR